MRRTVATFWVLASLVSAHGAAVDRGGQAVPRMPMPEGVYKTFRAALESYPFDEGSKKELLAKNLEALENLRSAPWPKLDGLERVRIYSLKEPARFFSAWRQPGDGDPLGLLMPDFTERRLPKSAFAKVEPVDLAAESADLLKYLKERDPEKKRPWDFTFFWDFGESGLPFHGGAFLLHHAYGAAYFGLEPEAKALVHEALKQHRLPFEQAYNEGAWQSFSQGITLLEEGAPRAEVLAQWRDTLKGYGRCRYRDQLLDLTGQLERQVEEDKKRSAAKVEDPDKLPLAERIAYHIARFPDVRGVQGSQPGHCRTLGIGEETKHSDAIVRIGRLALPALVEHLADRRVTRSVGFWRNFAPAREVLRVQDVVIECIEAILDIRFYIASSTSSYLSNERPEIRENVIADVTSWWAAYGRKPPVEGLVARLDKGRLWQRMETLRKIEAIDPKAVDARATLKRWAVGEDLSGVAAIAEALAARGDLSLQPAVREMERKASAGGSSEGVRFLLERGDADDYRFLRDAARREMASAISLGTPSLLASVASGVRNSRNPLAAPILVDLLARRETLGSRYDAATKSSISFSCADECMESLIRLTGHDEGYHPAEPAPKRHAAIDRWIAWWEKEGQAEYLAKHPQVARVLGEEDERVREVSLDGLPRLVAVADANRLAPVGFDVPREDLAPLVKSGGVEARRGPDGRLAFRFASAGAAAEWFAKARPVAPKSPEGAKPSLALLGPANAMHPPVIGPDGRAWFWRYVDRIVSTDEVKGQVEAAAASEEPRIEGANLLGVDRKGRVWLVPHANRQLLLGYDPKAKAWIERRGLSPDKRGYYNDGAPNVTAYVITGPLFESRSGRLFCGDRLGVHVLDGDSWSYQPFYERNYRENRWAGDIRSFNPPLFAEDREGNVYAWSLWGHSGWTGTVGFWTFDGTRWANVDAVERLAWVVPRGPGEVWLLGARDELVLLRDGKPVLGDEARKALCPGLSFRRARVATVGRDATAYLALEDVTVLEPFARVGRRGLGLPLRGPAVDLGNEAGDLLAYNWVVAGPRGWIFGTRGAVKAMSPDGKTLRTFPQTARLTSLQLVAGDASRYLYLYGSGSLWRLDTEADPALDGALIPALPAMRARVAGAASLDALGRMWCTWDAVGSPTAVFDGSAWKTFPRILGVGDTGEPRGFIAAFPGRDGAMVFEDARYGFHLFDSAGHATAKSLTQLILDQPERMRKALPSPLLTATNRHFHLAADADGRLWWSDGSRGWGVSDGGKATDAKASGLATGTRPGQGLSVLFPFGDGRRLLACGAEGFAAIVECRDGRIVQAAPAPFAIREMPPRGWRPAALRDRSGRLWIVAGNESHAVGPDGTRAATHPGWLLLEDRQGGLWFHLHPWDRVPRLVRLAPDGREVGIDIPNLLERACLSEAPDGTVWALTSSDLIRLRAGRDALAVIERYPLRIEHTDDLACDAEGRLWLRHTEPGERIGDYLIRYATAAKAE